MMLIIFLIILCGYLTIISSLLIKPTSSSQYSKIISLSKLNVANFDGLDHIQSGLKNIVFYLADTSVSEEDIINVTGETTDLPDPLFAVGFAVLIFLGVAVLQFSLGDLTKEV
jgi:hypothetical protein